MAKVFICYSRDSKAVVETMAQDLQSLGYEIWFDDKLVGRDEWWQSILQRIRDCDALVFAMSGASLDSVACTREREYAESLGKPVLPVLVDQNVSLNLLPMALATVQHVDYQVQDKQALGRLARAMVALPRAEPIPGPLPPEPDVPVSYLVDLRERIEDATHLDKAEQSTLLLELKHGLRKAGTREDARTLLVKFRKRSDLFETISLEIDDALRGKKGSLRQWLGVAGAIALIAVAVVWVAGGFPSGEAGGRGALAAGDQRGSSQTATPGPSTPSLTTMPDLSGQSKSRAEDALRKLGVEYTFEAEPADSWPSGQVIRHTPNAGEQFDASKVTVRLVIAKPVDVLRRPGEPEMVRVTAGSFRMGDLTGTGEPDEKPVRNVTIPRDFLIGRYEVTFEEYDAFVDATGRERPSDQGWPGGRRPVINVSWVDAKAYAAWLSAETGKRFRLPSEAEWEYVARAGTETDWWWGSEIQLGGEVWANCTGCGSDWDGDRTAPVGRFSANPFGLYDTVGNVSEWTADCRNTTYVGAPTDGTAWQAGNCARRVLRGGSWISDPQSVRSANRGSVDPGKPYNHVGFRLAQDIE